MVQEHTGTNSFRGARFGASDLNGVVVRECDVRGLRLEGCFVDDVQITAFSGDLGSVVVEGVDVTAYVLAELDRRHPERVQLRGVATMADHRAMWASVERLWAAQLGSLPPESLLHQRAGDEWSFVETLRHLVHAVDVWLGMLSGGPTFHPLGLPPTDAPPEQAVALGLDREARPSCADVVEVWDGRCAQVRAMLDRLTDHDLPLDRTGEPAPFWGIETRTVQQCLRTIHHEHLEHLRYAQRDLALLTS